MRACFTCIRNVGMSGVLGARVQILPGDASARESEDVLKDDETITQSKQIAS